MAAKGQNGFTLIELVIGITLFAIVLTIVTTVLGHQAVKSVTPIHQVRATELAQSMFNEILGKYYDENADRNGGRIRCNELLDNATDQFFCTAPSQLGPDMLGSDFEVRENFDDVDDYHGYTITQDDVIENSLGQSVVSENGVEFYNDFSVSVAVFYDNNYDGEADTASGNVKLVRITVTTPANQNLLFTTFKHNF